MGNVNDPADGKLYESFRLGDTSAYDQLMIRHGDSLTLYLYGYLHDWHDAEDLMIEAFARIMVKRPRIADGCFKAYLYKTARNLAARFHARRTKFSQFSFEEYPGEFADHELIEEKLVESERVAALHACLGRIDPELREALWLIYFENMSYAEAASVMKVNAKRVDHLLSRGKKQMRLELEQEGLTGAFG